MTAVASQDAFERWHAKLAAPVGRTWLLRSDLLIVAVVAGGSLAGALDPDTGLVSAALPSALVALVVAAGFLWRRRAPLPVALLTAVGLAVDGSRVPVFIALYCLARDQRSRRTLVIGLAWSGFTVLKALLPGHVGITLVGQFACAALYGAFPVVFGLGARAYERNLSALREERERRAEQTRTEERLRLAREMHDVLGHRIALMAMHAGAIEAAGAAHAEGRQLARAVGDTARAAMRDLRQVLGALRDGEGSVVAGRRLRDLDALVQEARSAGLPVEYTPVEAVPLPPEAALTAYRTVQEALTNIVKHAPGAPTAVRVRVRHEDATLSVCVANGPAPAGGPAGAPRTGAGFGMTGLRERVSLLSGAFAAGPTPDGGWVVRVTLPVGDGPGVLPARAALATGEGCAA
ncbi:sensor histidine kinase [Streptomyces sp. NPDC059708]|uniref:sensor histidine kinase n=1 Tax=Streptomyces sp. NPDC059708 TaxID=3346916 RepID=UPI00368C8823